MPRIVARRDGHGGALRHKASGSPSEPKSFLPAAATSSTAASNASWLALDGLGNPLIAALQLIRTSRSSWSVGG
jgi:hypothetical protein